MNNIKLELTIDETNMILRVLGQHPFAEVAAMQPAEQAPAA